MSNLFETDSSSSKRKETGSLFRLSGIPIEFTSYNCVYENPAHGLEIGFLAIFTHETFALKDKKHDRVIQRSIITGIILEKGALRTSLQRKLGSDVPFGTVDALVHDVYELIGEFFINSFSAFYDLREAGVKIGIYEAETRKFQHAFWTIPKNVRPGPETIASLQAEPVFPNRS